MEIWKVTGVLFRLSWHTSEMETAGIFSRCLPCYGLKLKVKLMYSGRSSQIVIFGILAFQRLSVIHSNSDQILVNIFKTGLENYNPHLQRW